MAIPLGEALVKNAKSQDHRQSGNKARTSIFTWLPNGQLPNSKRGWCWTPGRASDSWMLPARPTPLQRGDEVTLATYQKVQLRQSLGQVLTPQRRGCCQLLPPQGLGCSDRKWAWRCLRWRDRESCRDQAGEQWGRSLEGARLLAGSSRRTPGLWVPPLKDSTDLHTHYPGRASQLPAVPRQGWLLAT